VSPADLDSAVTALLQRTRAAQGLPEKIADVAVLDRVAALLSPERSGAAPVEGGSSTTIIGRAGTREVVNG
jgi:hypothetical protein